ncbi:hypothetical protein CCP2SC5_1560003 [Azospirillaceae bacterium]
MWGLRHIVTPREWNAYDVAMRYCGALLISAKNGVYGQDETALKENALHADWIQKNYIFLRISGG